MDKALKRTLMASVEGTSMSISAAWMTRMVPGLRSGSPVKVILKMNKSTKSFKVIFL